MARRLYLSSYALSSIGGISQSSVWESTAAWIASRANLTRLGSPTPGGSVSPSKTVATNPTDVLAGQFATPALNGAQTIAGNLTVTVKASESATGNDDFLQLAVRVTNERGTAVTGTLYAGQTQTVASAVASDPNGEFPVGTAAVRTVTVALSSVAAADRDRIVVELGYRSPTATTGHTATLRFGDDAGADLPATAGDTSTADAWIEFSQDINFLPLQTPDRRRVIALGDSLLADWTADMTADLTALGWETPKVDGLNGRFITTPGTTAFRSISLVHFFRAIPYEPYLWVIMLGANDVYQASAANHQGSIDTLLRLLDETGGPKRILWVNGCGNYLVGTGTPSGGVGGTFATFNGKLATTAAARRDMAVIDWASYAGSRLTDSSYWDTADTAQLHMTAAGYQAKRAFMRSEIARRTFNGWGIRA